MTTITLLLDRLDKVTGRDGKYTARCPAHEDKTPSLSITEAEDGKVLIKCHAGCPVEDIVGAVGLEVKDLFPESNLTQKQKHEYRYHKSRAEIEAALSHELIVMIQVVGQRVADRNLEKDSVFRKQRPDWTPMSNDHWDREILAAQRIKNALVVLYG